MDGRTRSPQEAGGPHKRWPSRGGARARPHAVARGAVSAAQMEGDCSPVLAGQQCEQTKIIQSLPRGPSRHPQISARMEIIGWRRFGTEAVRRGSEGTHRFSGRQRHGHERPEAPRPCTHMGGRTTMHGAATAGQAARRTGATAARRLARAVSLSLGEPSAPPARAVLWRRSLRWHQ